MSKIEFNKNKTQYLNLVELLMVVRDYKVELTNSEAHELARYELNLITYLQNLNKNLNIINLDIPTKTMLSYNQISYNRITDKELFNEELNLINEIKKFIKDL